MEQNLPIVAKKFRDIIRVLYLVLRKEISKGKLLFDLNMTLNRAKIADKLSAIQNPMFHHAAAAKHHLSQPDISVKKNDVSSGNILPFHLKKRKRHYVAPSTNEVLLASPLEIFNGAEASLALPGFGPSPIVKQVRISDSPYPLRDVDDQEHNIHVDEAAEEFIMKFYQNLRQQNGNDL